MFSMLLEVLLSARFAVVPTVAATSTVVDAAPACARGSRPPAVQIASSAELRLRYPALVPRLHGALDDRADTDACARVTLGLQGAAFVLTVALPDGRSTRRRVWQLDEVLPALEALLVLPRGPAKELATPASTSAVTATASAATASAATASWATSLSSTSPPSSSPPASVSFAPPVEPEAPALSARALPVATSAFRMELSLAAGARYGDDQAGARVALLTTVALADWLVGVQAAADRYEAGAQTPGSGDLGLSLLAGRRFRLRTLTLDLTAGPGVAVRGLAGRRTTAVVDNAMPTVEPVVGDGPWARLGAGVRLSFRTTSFLRLFTVLDGEMTKLGSAGGVNLGEAPLPRWTLGLGLGATVGEP